MLDTPVPKHKNNSSLTPASFEQLLSYLGPDREKAAHDYLELRRALFTYFAIRGATSPEDLTDETIDRVARRLNEGQTIFTASLMSYFYGVARNVWRENLSKPAMVAQLTDAGLPTSLVATPHDALIESLEAQASDRRLTCLRKCLAQYPDEDREMVLGYYRESGGQKIENRKALAAQFGLSLDALRHKLARLRIKLASCIGRCVKTTPSA